MLPLAPLTSPPATEAALLQQAQRLAGYSLGELAVLAGLPVPPDLKRDKGWTGVLLELWLGPARAANQNRILPPWGWN